MDCSLPGSSVHGIFQARVLEWGAIAFSVCHVRKSFFKKALPVSAANKSIREYLSHHNFSEFYFLCNFHEIDILLC